MSVNTYQLEAEALPSLVPHEMNCVLLQGINAVSDLC